MCEILLLDDKHSQQFGKQLLTNELGAKYQSKNQAYIPSLKEFIICDHSTGGFTKHDCLLFYTERNKRVKSGRKLKLLLLRDISYNSCNEREEQMQLTF